MGDDLFRSVFFSYVCLIAFDNDLKCKLCGDSPDTIVWDGITLSFGKKHIRSTLRPPTITSPASISRNRTKYYPGQQAITDRKVRADIRKILEGPAIEFSMDALGIDSAVSSPTKPPNVADKRARHKKLVDEHIARIERVSPLIRKVDPALEAFFVRHFGLVAFASDRAASPAIMNLMKQVCVKKSLPAVHFILSDIRFCFSWPLRSRSSNWFRGTGSKNYELSSPARRRRGTGQC